MPHDVKRGDCPKLTWDLGVDLTTATAARVLIAPTAPVDHDPILDQAGVIEAPATAGLVSLQLAPADWTPEFVARKRAYLVEVELTTPDGPITHPSDGYERLTVTQDLG